LLLWSARRDRRTRRCRTGGAEFLRADESGVCCHPVR
jgi:hypothetical protein